MAQPVVIAVEGLIGAGKSTLIQEVLLPALSKKHRVKIIREPVEGWVASGLLQRFYGDQKRWSYTFQTKAFFDRITEARRVMSERSMVPENEQADVILMERSPLSDQIFMRTLREEGAVDELEMSMYQDWCYLWHTFMPFTISLFLYVRTDLDQCMTRLHTRSREGEAGVSCDYQARLLQEHEAEFRRPMTKDGTRCWSLEGNCDYRTDQAKRDRLVRWIEDFCAENAARLSREKAVAALCRPLATAPTTPPSEPVDLPQETKTSTPPMPAPEEPWKMVLVVRTDLKMGKGKIAAQCTHAGVGACLQLSPQEYRHYRRSGQTKVVVKVSTWEALEELQRQAEAQHLVHQLQVDAGLTQIPEHSPTVLALGPAPASAVDRLTRTLSLL